MTTKRTPAAAKQSKGLLDAPKGILDAGLRMLNVKPDEGEDSKPAEEASSKWSFGRLEEVFDERVASALERLGVPSLARITELTKRIEELERQVEELSKKRR